MKKPALFICVFLTFIGVSFAVNGQKVVSPNGNIELTFSLTELGEPQYEVRYQNQLVVLPSKLGIKLKDDTALSSDFSIETAKTAFEREVWKPVLGEVDEIVNLYKELSITLLQKSTQRQMIIRFRAYDEGVAFRYEFPAQKNLHYFVVADELTQFGMYAHHKAFWIPGDFDTNEYSYNECQLDEISTFPVSWNNGIGFKGARAANRVQAPLQMKTADGIYLNIFEAAVQNYPVMHLTYDAENKTFTSTLVPNALGDKAYLRTPSHTPWRTIMMSHDARDLVASKLILNLNEPCAITDTSWIKPMKYVGIWWEMHVGVSTWDYAGSQNAQNNGPLVATGKHGATTKNAKKYIDFAAKHGFDGVLIEGWNTGWEDWFGNWKEDVFDFVTPYPDFDQAEVSKYADLKKVKLIMHHETSGSVANYERWLDRAFKQTKKFHYPAIKTGYVGRIIPRGEWHDGQTMINHYHHVVQRAAEQQLMINSHESARPTGMHRTYPNYIAAEAARGNEFNAWSVGNPPSHETILPFTRLLGGPMDYTPGIFELQMSHYNPSKKEQVHTTLAKQLALYVTMYSPLQMAADLPENYERYLDAFQFIKAVPVNWSDTKVLEAEPNDYITIARRGKNSADWFIGAITDEQARTANVILDFLKPGQKYEATIYEDAPDAHWQTNPKAYKIRKISLQFGQQLAIPLAAGGGAAIHIQALK
ncbi:MAG: alpha-glucosidase [Flavobacterium sp. BFFFF2]|nr:MAG: alpha-glucosidase [Flavobacterium sp. BFFFF2]